MNEFEHSGEWRLPHEPDRRLSGTLRSTLVAGLRLSLIDRFGFQELHEVILGRVADVGPATLTTCLLTRLNSSGRDRTDQLQFAEYRAELAFLGSHLVTSDAQRFNTVTVEYSHLFDWIGISGIDHAMPGEDDIDEFGVTHRLPPSITERIAAVSGEASIEATVEFGPGVAESRRERSVTLQEPCAIRFESDQPWSVSEWLRRVVAPVRDFLTFVVGAPNAITGFTIPYPDDEMRSARIVFQPDHVLDTEKRPSRFEMLMPYQEIAGRFEEVLNVWMGLYGTIARVIRLLMLARAQQGEFPILEGQFLAIVQAVKSYHRQRRPGGENPEEEYQKRRDRIAAAVSEEDRFWLDSKLKYANVKHLRRRLKELVDETKIREQKRGASAEDVRKRHSEHAQLLHSF
jgi:hypothetical protein